MKITRLLSVVALITFFFGCSSDDPKTTLDGNWNLVRVEGGFTAINDSFSNGEIKWKFNENDGTFTVTNNNANPEKEDMLKSGTYTYMIIDTEEGAECSKNLMVDVVDFGCYKLEGRRLKIGSTSADGYLLTLER